MNTRLHAHELRNDGDWVGIPTRLPALAAGAGEWVHLTADDPATASRAVALLAGQLRATSGSLRFEVDGRTWEPTNGSAHLWAWLRRAVIHHAGGYLPIAPSEPVHEAVARLTGAPAGDLLEVHDLARLAGRRWGELAQRPRHRVSLVVALAGRTPIVLLDMVQAGQQSLIEHARQRAEAGTLVVSAGDQPLPDEPVRTIHLPDEGNR